MKRTLAFLLAVACVAFCASIGFAAEPNYDAVDKLHNSGREMDFINSLNKLGNQVVAHNKHAFETKYQAWEDEEPYTMWSRVWAKDKTIVTALAGKDKKFISNSLTTADPNMVFAGGIKVGASTAVLEKFFKAPLRQIAYRPGVIYAPAESDFDAENFYIFYGKDGKITEIRAEWGVFHGRSDKTEKFIEKMRKQLGFPNSNFDLLKFD